MRRLLDWERQSIIDAYSDGEKTAAIGAEFGVSPKYAGILARRRGRSTRSVGRPKRQQGSEPMVLENANGR